eukprot:696678-Prymnesium_polylepis.1
MLDTPHTFFYRRNYNVQAQEFNILEGMEDSSAGPAPEPMECDGRADEPAPAAAAAGTPQTSAKPRRNEMKERVTALELHVAQMRAELVALMPLLATRPWSRRRGVRSARHGKLSAMSTA